ncbi:MAG: 50S ribosomal protein L31e [Candidatus Pacearchaeota archaeon]
MVKEKETKTVLERTYTIPLRKEWLKAPRYKRAKKAMRAIKEFLARHMKVSNRDLDKIKIDPWVNRALWLRGIKKPPHKITVKATKDANDNVKVEFVSLPNNFKVEDAKLKRKIEKVKKLEEEKSKEREKKKKEEAKKKEEREKKEEEKTEEEKLEEKEEKEKEKMLRKEVLPEQPKIKQPQQHKEHKEMRRMTLEK